MRVFRPLDAFDLLRPCAPLVTASWRAFCPFGAGRVLWLPQGAARGHDRRPRRTFRAASAVPTDFEPIYIKHIPFLQGLLHFSGVCHITQHTSAPQAPNKLGAELLNTLFARSRAVHVSDHA